MVWPVSIRLLYIRNYGFRNNKKKKKEKNPDSFIVAELAFAK